jgi:hypothetical protein
MKDYAYIQKLNKQTKEKDRQFFAWTLTIILVILVLWVMFSISGPAPIVDGHM